MCATEERVILGDVPQPGRVLLGELTRTVFTWRDVLQRDDRGHSVLASCDDRAPALM